MVKFLIYLNSSVDANQKRIHFVCDEYQEHIFVWKNDKLCQYVC